MHPFNAILECLGLGRSVDYDVLEEKPTFGYSDEKKQHPQDIDSHAADIIRALYRADTNDEYLLQDVVHETGWYDSLAAAVLKGLEDALKAETPMGQAMKVAYEKSAQVTTGVWGFAKDHPVFCALVALGILVLLAPWAIEVLGFGELGPIEGSLAARWWQPMYGGSVPKGSWFSFFQRLGMTWRLA